VSEPFRAPAYDWPTQAAGPASQRGLPARDQPVQPGERPKRARGTPWRAGQCDGLAQLWHKAGPTGFLSLFSLLLFLFAFSFDSLFR
jgi:hypothetical protein